MTITPPVKLILSMLAALHENLNIDPQTARFVKAAVASDNTWALSWEFPEFFGEQVEPFPTVVTEVSNYLHMWTCIEKSLKFLPIQERIEVAQSAKGPTTFPGFDSEKESEHFSSAHFIITHMRRFTNFNAIELDAHYPTLPRIESMYANFAMLQMQCNVRCLTKAELIAIFDVTKDTGIVRA